jgi:outer membrane protein TolC
MKSYGIRVLSWTPVAALLLCCAGIAVAQEAPAPTNPAPTKEVQQGTPAASAALRLTLQDALALARKNSTQFQSALTDAGLAREDKTQARDALLPGVNYNTQALYTESNGPGNGVRYIANNSVHEYISQGNVHQTLDLASISSFRRASAAAAVARAKAEIASRGLVVTVVQSYYAVAAAQQKLQSALKAADEGDRFFNLTQDLEHGGEVAHSDVIKAELQMQERRRQLLEAQLGFLNSRLDLAVLIFPDFNDNYEVADDLHSAVPLPALAEVQQQAARDNPDLRAALAAVREAGSGVTGARAGYLPSLALDYWYGIDAPRFAANSVINGQKFSNFGSSASATLSIPIWNWGATQSRIKQAELRRSQAQRELSLAQRKLLAEIRSLYAEAETALNELAGLNRSAELAAESLRLITLRYKDGEATVLEVVDAQTTNALANSAYQDGAVRYRVALANLQTLTGVLTTP